MGFRERALGALVLACALSSALSGQSLLFDGKDDYVLLPVRTIPPSWTISLQFRLAVPYAPGTLVGWTGSAYKRGALLHDRMVTAELDPQRRIVVYVHAPGYSPAPSLSMTPSAALAMERWYQFSLSYSNDTRAIIASINGAPFATATLGFSYSCPKAEALSVAASPALLDAAGVPTSGFLRTYVVNVAFTESFVSAENASAIASGGFGFKNSLRHRFPLTRADLIQDQGFANATAAATQVPSRRPAAVEVASPFCSRGKQLYWNGQSVQFVTLNEINALSPSWSFNIFVRNDDASVARTILYWTTRQSSRVYAAVLAQVGSTYRFVAYAGDGSVSADMILPIAGNATSWHAVGVTYEDARFTFRGYVDGAPVASALAAKPYATGWNARLCNFAGAAYRAALANATLCFQGQTVPWMPWYFPPGSFTYATGRTFRFWIRRSSGPTPGDWRYHNPNALVLAWDGGCCSGIPYNNGIALSHEGGGMCLMSFQYQAATTAWACGSTTNGDSRQWTHVTIVHTPGSGYALYTNGRYAAFLSTTISIGTVRIGYGDPFFIANFEAYSGTITADEAGLIAPSPRMLAMRTVVAFDQAGTTIPGSTAFRAASPTPPSDCEGSIAYTRFTSCTFTTLVQEMYLGRGWDLSPVGSSATPFLGAMAELTFWDAALSAAQFRQAATSSALPVPDRLLYRYTLNHGKYPTNLDSVRTPEYESDDFFAGDPPPDGFRIWKGVAPAWISSPDPSVPTHLSYQYDLCGLCGGTNASCVDCFGVPNGPAKRDVCGVCGGNGTSCLGCDGVPFSGKRVDACGVCGGLNSCRWCKDGSQLDACGVCGGNSTTCAGCDGVPNSLRVFDQRGVCGGMAFGALADDPTQCALAGGANTTQCTVAIRVNRYVRIPLPDVCGSHALDAWVLRNGTGGGVLFDALFWNVTVAADGATLVLGNGTASANCTLAGMPATYGASQWTHVGASFDAVQRRVLLYVNSHSEAVAGQACAALPAAPDVCHPAFNRLFLGSRPENDRAQAPVLAVEVRAWSTARSGPQMRDSAQTWYRYTLAADAPGALPAVYYVPWIPAPPATAQAGSLWELRGAHSDPYDTSVSLVVLPTLQSGIYYGAGRVERAWSCDPRSDGWRFGRDGVCRAPSVKETTRLDCRGVPFGNATLDPCGRCNGDGSTCAGCDGVPNSGKRVDECGVCGGTSTSCLNCMGRLVANNTRRSAGVDQYGICNADGDWPYSCVPGSYTHRRNPAGACVDVSDPIVAPSMWNYDVESCAERGPWVFFDACGVCGGNNSTCGSDLWCDRVPYSGKTFRGVAGGAKICDSPERRCDAYYDPCGNCPPRVSGWTCPSGTPCGKPFDLCGVCGGDNSSCTDCAGTLFGTARIDVCGVCGGDGSACLGCDMVPASGRRLDACGVCGGDGTSCLGCDGVPFSGKVYDAFGRCGGPDVDRTTSQFDACGVRNGTGSGCTHVYSVGLPSVPTPTVPTLQTTSQRILLPGVYWNNRPAGAGSRPFAIEFRFRLRSTVRSNWCNDVSRGGSSKSMITIRLGGGAYVQLIAWCDYWCPWWPFGCSRIYPWSENYQNYLNFAFDTRVWHHFSLHFTPTSGLQYLVTAGRGGGAVTFNYALYLNIPNTVNWGEQLGLGAVDLGYDPEYLLDWTDLRIWGASMTSSADMWNMASNWVSRNDSRLLLWYQPRFDGTVLLDETGRGNSIDLAAQPDYYRPLAGAVDLFASGDYWNPRSWPQAVGGSATVTRPSRDAAAALCAEGTFDVWIEAMRPGKRLSVRSDLTQELQDEVYAIVPRILRARVEDSLTSLRLVFESFTAGVASVAGPSMPVYMGVSDWSAGWQHVAVVVGPSGASVYQNGTLVGTLAVTQANRDACAAAAGEFSIVSTGRANFTEARIWSFAMDATRVAFWRDMPARGSPPALLYRAAPMAQAILVEGTRLARVRLDSPPGLPYLQEQQLFSCTKGGGDGTAAPCSNVLVFDAGARTGFGVSIRSSAFSLSRCTVDLWVSVNATGLGRTSTLFDVQRRGVAVPRTIYRLSLDAAGRPTLSTGAASGVVRSVACPAIANDRFVHLAAAFEPETATLYVDGLPCASSGNAYGGDATYDSSRAIAFGHAFASNGSLFDFASVLVAEARIWAATADAAAVLRTRTTRDLGAVGIPIAAAYGRGTHVVGSFVPDDGPEGVHGGPSGAGVSLPRTYCFAGVEPLPYARISLDRSFYDACGRCGGGNATCYRDCDGVVMGPRRPNQCGRCDGDLSCLDCAGVPFGPDRYSCVACDGDISSGKAVDASGVCGGEGRRATGCDGVPGSGRRYDLCGVCGGDNSTCLGCDRVPNSGKVPDACGVCGGNNSTCLGCDGVPNSGKARDRCGRCDSALPCLDCGLVPNPATPANFNPCGRCDAADPLGASCTVVGNDTYGVCSNPSAADSVTIGAYRFAGGAAVRIASADAVGFIDLWARADAANGSAIRYRQGDGLGLAIRFPNENALALVVHRGRSVVASAQYDGPMLGAWRRIGIALGVNGTATFYVDGQRWGTLPFARGAGASWELGARCPITGAGFVGALADVRARRAPPAVVAGSFVLPIVANDPDVLLALPLRDGFGPFERAFGSLAASPVGLRAFGGSLLRHAGGASTSFPLPATSATASTDLALNLTISVEAAPAAGDWSLADLSDGAQRASLSWRIADQALLLSVSGYGQTHLGYAPEILGALAAGPESPPAAPAVLDAAVRSSAEVNVTWACDAASDWGAALFRNGSLLARTRRAAGWWLDAGLRRATAYAYAASCVSRAGFGPRSPERVATTDPLAPAAVGALRTVAVDATSVALAWDAPADDGGRPVLEYRVYGSVNATLPPSARAFNATGLARAGSYSFWVQPATEVGAGPAAGIAVTTLPTAPGAPSNVSVSAITSSSFVVSFGMPADSGGRAITRATVYVNGSVAGDYATSPLSVRGLARLTLYLVEVEVWTSVGASPRTPVLATTGADVPSAPAILSAALNTTSSPASVTITLTASVDTGGLPLAACSVFRNGTLLVGSAVPSGPNATLSVRDASPPEGAPATYVASCASAAGTGAASAPSAPVQIPSPIPSPSPSPSPAPARRRLAQAGAAPACPTRPVAGQYSAALLPASGSARLNVSALLVQGGFAVDLFFRLPRAVSYDRIFHFGTGQLAVVDDGTTFSLMWYANSNSWHTIRTYGTRGDNRWRHVVVYVPPGYPGLVYTPRVYADGEPCASAQDPNNPNALRSTRPAADALYVSMYAGDANQGWTVLGDVALLEGIYSDAELSALSSSPYLDPWAPGVAGYFSLGDGSGNLPACTAGSLCAAAYLPARGEGLPRTWWRAPVVGGVASAARYPVPADLASGGFAFDFYARMGFGAATNDLEWLFRLGAYANATLGTSSSPACGLALSGAYGTLVWAGWPAAASRVEIYPQALRFQTWRHVTVVVPARNSTADATYEALVYVDGALVWNGAPSALTCPRPAANASVVVEAVGGPDSSFPVGGVSLWNATANVEASATPASSPGSSPPYASLVAGWYDGESWAGSAWADRSGNRRNATEIRGAPVAATESGVRVLYGGAGDGVRLPASVMSPGMTGYTLFYITRYRSPGPYARIIDGVTRNFLSGHWGGRVGVAHHDTWITDYDGRPYGQLDWILGAENSNTYRANGADATRASDAMYGDRISVNHGASAGGESSSWACAAILVYSSRLGPAETARVEAWLRARYPLWPSAVRPAPPPASAGALSIAARYDATDPRLAYARFDGPPERTGSVAASSATLDWPAAFDLAPASTPFRWLRDDLPRSHFWALAPNTRLVLPEATITRGFALEALFRMTGSGGEWFLRFGTARLYAYVSAGDATWGYESLLFQGQDNVQWDMTYRRGLRTSAWNHIVVYYPGGAAGGTFTPRIFMNGALAASENRVPPAQIFVSARDAWPATGARTMPLYLGSGGGVVSFGAVAVHEGNFTDGALAELSRRPALWTNDTALAALYEADTGLRCRSASGNLSASTTAPCAYGGAFLTWDGAPAAMPFGFSYESPRARLPSPSAPEAGPCRHATYAGFAGRAGSFLGSNASSFVPGGPVSVAFAAAGGAAAPEVAFAVARPGRAVISASVRVRAPVSTSASSLVLFGGDASAAGWASNLAWGGARYPLTDGPGALGEFFAANHSRPSIAFDTAGGAWTAYGDALAPRESAACADPAVNCTAATLAPYPPYADTCDQRWNVFAGCDRGVCGKQYLDCDGVPGGFNRPNACGRCDGRLDCVDCRGVPFGGAVVDACGVCGGNNATCSDCRGVVNGTAYRDACGLCVASPEESVPGCLGCDGSPFSRAWRNETGQCRSAPRCLVTGKTFDACGVCGGDGRSCARAWCDGRPYSGAYARADGSCAADPALRPQPLPLYADPCTPGLYAQPNVAHECTRTLANRAALACDGAAAPARFPVAAAPASPAWGAAVWLNPTAASPVAPALALELADGARVVVSAGTEGRNRYASAYLEPADGSAPVAIVSRVAIASSGWVLVAASLGSGTDGARFVAGFSTFTTPGIPWTANATAAVLCPAGSPHRGRAAGLALLRGPASDAALAALRAAQDPWNHTAVRAYFPLREGWGPRANDALGGPAAALASPVSWVDASELPWRSSPGIDCAGDWRGNATRDACGACVRPGSKGDAGVTCEALGATEALVGYRWAAAGVHPLAVEEREACPSAANCTAWCASTLLRTQAERTVPSYLGATVLEGACVRTRLQGQRAASVRPDRSLVRVDPRATLIVRAGTASLHASLLAIRSAPTPPPLPPYVTPPPTPSPSPTPVATPPPFPCDGGVWSVPLADDPNYAGDGTPLCVEGGSGDGRLATATATPSPTPTPLGQRGTVDIPAIPCRDFGAAGCRRRSMATFGAPTASFPGGGFVACRRHAIERGSRFFAAQREASAGLLHCWALSDEEFVRGYTAPEAAGQCAPCPDEPGAPCGALSDVVPDDPALVETAARPDAVALFDGGAPINPCGFCNRTCSGGYLDATVKAYVLGQKADCVVTVSALQCPDYTRCEEGGSGFGSYDCTWSRGCVERHQSFRYFDMGPRPNASALAGRCPASLYVEYAPEQFTAVRCTYSPDGGETSASMECYNSLNRESVMTCAPDAGCVAQRWLARPLDFGFRSSLARPWFAEGPTDDGTPKGGDGLCYAATASRTGDQAINVGEKLSCASWCLKDVFLDNRALPDKPWVINETCPRDGIMYLCGLGAVNGTARRTGCSARAGGVRVTYGNEPTPVPTPTPLPIAPSLNRARITALGSFATVDAVVNGVIQRLETALTCVNPGLANTFQACPPSTESIYGCDPARPCYVKGPRFSSAGGASGPQPTAPPSRGAPLLPPRAPSNVYVPCTMLLAGDTTLQTTCARLCEVATPILPPAFPWIAYSQRTCPDAAASGRRWGCNLATGCVDMGALDRRDAVPTPTPLYATRPQEDQVTGNAFMPIRVIADGVSSLEETAVRCRYQSYSSQYGRFVDRLAVCPYGNGRRYECDAATGCVDRGPAYREEGLVLRPVCSDDIADFCGGCNKTGPCAAPSGSLPVRVAYNSSVADKAALVQFLAVTTNATTGQFFVVDMADARPAALRRRARAAGDAPAPAGTALVLFVPAASGGSDPTDLLAALQESGGAGSAVLAAFTSPAYASTQPTNVVSTLAAVFATPAPTPGGNSTATPTPTPPGKPSGPSTAGIAVAVLFVIVEAVAGLVFFLVLSSRARAAAAAARARSRRGNPSRAKARVLA